MGGIQNFREEWIDMNDEQRQELIRRLQHGEELSPEWARTIFPPEKREYELVYHGKEREEDIIANTLAVPLQKVRTFGKNGDDWHNMLIFGDNMQVMKSLLAMKKSGQLRNQDGSDGVRLVYIDPPFATKKDFSGTEDQKAYQDKLEGAVFIEFLRKRLVILRELLSDDGSIYVHLDSRKSHYLKVVLDEIFSGYEFAEIVWVCGLMGSGKFFPKAHETIFCYKSQTAPFAPPHRLGYSERITGALQKDKNGWFYTRGRESSGGSNYLRTYISNNSKLSMEEAIAEATKSRPQTAWSVWIGKEDLATKFNDFPVGTYAYTAHEKVGYPTQKPELLLSRIINASSRKGDIVLDAFAGSGTTLAVAEKFGRRWVGIDCGKLAIYTIQKRMLNLLAETGNKGLSLKPKPFGLYNAGLYDFSKLKELSWDAWRFFALQLFQCRDEPHKIGGIQIDGYLRGSSVLVFNHQKQPGVRINEETIQSIHEALGSKVGSRMFIIAPALVFDFQQDYLTLDGVRYYALRIPYSIIHELHQREFKALKQPADELAVNDTVDAVGFDFVRRPELDYEAGANKRKGELIEEGFIKIKTFKSEAVVREPMRKKGNRETLSMVMLDYDFDSESDVFAFDAVFYAEAIEKAKWEVRFPVDAIGNQIMAVFVDIYGNEAREVIPAMKFGVAKAKAAAKPAMKKTRK
ncbi:MAG: site-specific DNA-methyltransferase [Elusimicrobia bacterium]|nr:site-specific DNA-methyltransferase [Candidatus Obscuribacterium magneticum]